MTRWATVIMLGVCLAVLGTACAGGPTTSSTGEYIDDSTTTTKIKSSFLVDKTVSAFDIKVQTFRGVVILSGFVNTQEQKDRAISIAKGTAGVREVKAEDLVLTPRR